MENKKIIAIIIVIIITIGLVYYLINRKSSEKIKSDNSEEEDNETSNITTNSTTLSTPSTSINTTTSTPPTLESNPIVLSKIVAPYYLQLPGSGSNKTPVYKPSDTTVAGVTFPPGTSLTVNKIWDFGGNQVFYEITEQVKYLTNPSSYGLGDYYLIKKSDL